MEDVDNVFTVRELAKYLRMKPLTIYKHASAGKLPGFKVGSHWRFKKETIDRWIESQESTNRDQKTLINA
ncbi:MAG: helix-turn-helix domain-containing protein [Candidatus Omnitrophota bacterium]